MRKFISLVILLLLGFSVPAFAVDSFGPTGQESPAVADYAITPSDTVPLYPIPRGVYIGVGGDLTVVLMNSPAPVTYVGLPQGIIFSIRPRLIYATGTTATNLNAMY